MLFWGDLWGCAIRALGPGLLYEVNGHFTGRDRWQRGLCEGQTGHTPWRQQVGHQWGRPELAGKKVMAEIGSGCLPSCRIKTNVKNTFRGKSLDV